MKIDSIWKEKEESGRSWQLKEINPDTGWCIFIPVIQKNKKDCRLMHKDNVPRWLSPA